MDHCVLECPSCSKCWKDKGHYCLLALANSMLLNREVDECATKVNERTPFSCKFGVHVMWEQVHDQNDESKVRHTLCPVEEVEKQEAIVQTL